MSDNDGITIVLDFTGRYDVESTREVQLHSFRSTTSSRKPGAAIQGTVVTNTRRVVTCHDCKGKRIDFDSPHALVDVREGLKRDCAGRLYRNGELIK
jgi:hypothetical protein